MSEVFNQIIMIGAVISAFGVMIGVVWKVKSLIDKQEKALKEIKQIKIEQKLTFTALNACLDGLQQLGANHTVPAAKAELEKWLNEQAHD